MKKLTKIIAGLAALVLSVGVVGCSNKSTDYPNFRKTDSYEQQQPESEKYTINVRSEGGYKLDGVKVTAYNPKGEPVKTGISSDGVINLGLTLDEYTLKVDENSLPEGYFVKEGSVFKTNPKKRDPVDITVSSAVIPQSAAASKVYAVGDIVNDFTIKDYRGKEYKLSTLLKEKKAVVLNFWFTTCGPCIQEFPSLQSAYLDYKKDLEILGLAFPNRVRDDAEIASFKEENKKNFDLTFPLAIGTSSILSNYSASAAPTTAVIDRYGMLAYWHANSEPSVTFWQSLFKKYTADDYIQEINEDPENPGGNPSLTLEKPNVEMPAGTEMAAAANGAGLSATYRADEEDEYAWPWTVGNDEVYGKVITVTNTGKQGSYATLYVDIVLKKDDLLSFDYTVSSEKDNDKLYVLLDGQLINAEGWSGQIGWTSEDVYVADRDKTVELTFIYLKDEGDPTQDKIGDDTVKIKNIRTSAISADTEALDVIREAASGEPKEGKYSNYTQTVLGDDGYYHVGSKTGPLLYMSISNITPWSALHTTDSKIETADGSAYASLYDMTFYKYSNTIEDEAGNLLGFTVMIGDRDFAEPLIEYHHILDVLEKPYQLMPVTPQLKDWAQTFTAEYEKEKGFKSHENEWLEFCFYYDHYGKPHGTDDYCREDTNILEGLTIYDSYEIGFRTTPADGESIGKQYANVAYALARPNGVYYKFTALADGVYQIRDFGTGSAYPSLAVYELKEDGLNPEYLQFCDGVMDFDAQINPVAYGSFNSYVVLSKGQTVYLHFRIDEQTTGDFSFDITYHSSVDKLINCSTADGAWTYDENGVFVYLGIRAAYDSATDRYFHADAHGNPDRDRPVYINMIYQNFYMSDLGINSMPVSQMIEKNIFRDKVGAGEQTEMAVYFNESLKNTGEFYGLVEADARIVEILNTLIKNTGGSGDNRGWLAFACYTDHYRHSATQLNDGGNLAYAWNEITSISGNTATVTFTAPDAGVYDFGVPEGSVVTYDGGNLEIIDGVAKVLLFRGETVTVTVNKDANGAPVPVSVFKSINMYQTGHEGGIYTGNNIISDYDNLSASLTFTADEPGLYEIDLSKFDSATVTVEGVAIPLTEGVGEVTLVSGQKVNITVTTSTPEKRIVFAVTQLIDYREVNSGKQIDIGYTLIAKYEEDGTAKVTVHSPSGTGSLLENEARDYTITVTDFEGTPEITLNGEKVTVTVKDGKATATVSLKRTDTVEITVKKAEGYKHTLIKLDY